MEHLDCPVCHTSAQPLLELGGITICRTCGASLVASPDGFVRPAKAADTTILPAATLTALRTASLSIREPSRT